MTSVERASALREDDTFVLLRSPKRADRDSVLIIASAEQSPTPASLARIQRAYLLRNEIDPTWGTRPIAVVVHDGRPALLLEDPGGVVLEELLGKVGLEDLLRLSAGVAAAVSMLHDAGLIHRDLKPSNILVDPSSGRAWLTGLCLAEHLPLAGQAGSGSVLAGTLPYIAPEQTGRVTRAVDSRADLYSVGVTLYQLATGSLPFLASEPMEWVHSHVARLPLPPLERGRHLPEMLQRVLMKLLEKDPDERYQTAAGLAHDLRQCLALRTADGDIATFPLGSRDTPSHLARRPGFHGRTAELEALQEARVRVEQRAVPEIVLVTGYAGLGKSSLVHEFLQRGVPPGTLVASAKLDELESDAPYAALSQAFRELTRWVLARTGEELGHWQESLARALEPNAALLAQLVPELELVLGAAPAVPALPADEARNRAYATFRQFLRVFANSERRLVLFLDDLQWLDSATLELLQYLLLDPALSNLLLIGAYRSNLVGPEHPLQLSLERLRAAGREVRELSLPPLESEQVARLVADSIFTSTEAAVSLSRGIEQKTGGNPFFIRQFLSSLVEEGLLTFDVNARRWGWDLPRILAKGHTDNLAELVLGRLARLPEATQHSLKVLACLAPGTPAALLVPVLELTREQIDESLEPALEAQVITFSSDGYAFRHDRLQEAAYSLIPESERPARHLAIGRRLRAHENGTSGDGLFEVVRHLNRGLELIDEPSERVELAELNLDFARRSRATAADSNAIGHLDIAWRLLPSDSWNSLPDLTFEIALARAECEFLIGDRAQAELLLRELATHTQDPTKLGAVVCAELVLHTTARQMDRAVAVGLDYLRRVGVSWVQIDASEVRREYQRLLSAQQGRDMAELAELPAMSSPTVRAIMDVCAALVSPAHFVDRNLYSLLVLRMASLSLEHGNSDSSCLAYALLCLVLGPTFGDHVAGLAFGELGARLVKGGLNRFTARVFLPMGAIIVPKTTGLHAGLAWLQSAFEAAEKSGDLVYAVYTRTFSVSLLLSAGTALEDADREARAALAYARRSRFAMMDGWISVQLGLIRSLRGAGVELGSLSSEGFDEDEYERGLREGPDHFFFWVRRLQARYFAGDFAEARRAAQQARRLVWTSAMFPEEVEYWFFAALAEAACATDSTTREAVEVIAGYEEQLSFWAERCPESFASKAALVGAERARLEGREAAAERKYELASELARKYRLIHEQALAHELSARLYSARGITSVAESKYRSARACYLQWGALAKVQNLDRQAGLDSLVGFSLPNAVQGSLEQLELDAVVAALHAVSSSLELNTLIDGLMQSALQQAAADRALLILLGDEPRVRAEAISHAGSIKVTPTDAPLAPRTLPASILRFVLRTREKVLLETAQLPTAFASEEYLQNSRVRSLLCLPIIVGGKAVGALYLENSLTSQAFGPKGLAVLELIASQAGISLENARLYAGLHRAQLRMSRAERVSRTGSFNWKPDTREFGCSDEMSRIYGIDEAPSLALMRERTHPEDRALFDSLLDDAGRFDGKTVEHRLLLPDGSLKHVAIISSRVTGQRVTEYAGTVRDVSEARRADEALQRTQSALADMTRVASLGEMAAAIAHEVNQPLSAIGLNASTCLRWLDESQLDPAEAREAALRIRRDAERAGAVVKRLRALFSKSEGVHAPVDLNDAIAEVLALVRSRIRGSGARLKLELESDLPPALGDRVQLQQVIMNLVINALEAMRGEASSPRELCVRTSSRLAGRLLCEIQDNGRGIPEADRRRIFEPFFSTKDDGMGIGLSICSNILASHGGQLSVRDNGDDVGATFAFEIPRAPSD